MEAIMTGIDCASTISADAAAQIAEAGYGFACRYLVPEYYQKHLTAEEAQSLLAAGLKILCVFETTAARMKDGAAAGAADGQTAYQLAVSMGIPTTVYIYFAVDFDAQDVDMDEIEAYLRVARQQTGDYEVGVYGSYRVIEAMAARGVCRGFWQCLAWSYGQTSDSRTAYQYGFNQTVAGIPVDIDEAYSLEGLWGYEPKAESEDEDMKYYDTIDEVPDYGKATVQKLINAGALKGTDNGLNISDDMLRVLVINDRMGLYK